MGNFCHRIDTFICTYIFFCLHKCSLICEYVKYMIKWLPGRLRKENQSFKNVKKCYRIVFSYDYCISIFFKHYMPNQIHFLSFTCQSLKLKYCIKEIKQPTFNTIFVIYLQYVLSANFLMMRMIEKAQQRTIIQREYKTIFKVVINRQCQYNFFAAKKTWMWQQHNSRLHCTYLQSKSIADSYYYLLDKMESFVKEQNFPKLLNAPNVNL